MHTIEIPEKTFFKIGEVAKLLELEPHVLRYWETEFENLSPRKTRSGQRSYQQRDIELLIVIRHLLYEEMYTIAGARRQFDRLEAIPIEKMLTHLRAPQRSEDERVKDLREARLRVEELEATVAALRCERDELQDELLQLELEQSQTSLLELSPAESSQPTDDEVRLNEELDRMRERVAELQIERETLEERLLTRNEASRSRLSDLRSELTGLSRLASQPVH